MQAGFLVVKLPGETQVVFEQATVAVRIAIGLDGAEGIGGIPAPDRGVGAVQDHPGCIKVVGLDGIELE